MVVPFSHARSILTPTWSNTTLYHFLYPNMFGIKFINDHSHLYDILTQYLEWGEVKYMKIRTILGLLFLITLVVGSVGVATADDCCTCPCCNGNGNTNGNDCECECTCPDDCVPNEWDGPDHEV